MTFEEYKRTKEKNVPRSWSATMIMAAVAAATVVFIWVNIIAIQNDGLTFIRLGSVFFALLIAFYAGLVAYDGKWKSAREALYSLFVFWPLP